MIAALRLTPVFHDLDPIIAVAIAAADQGEALAEAPTMPCEQVVPTVHFGGRHRAADRRSSAFLANLQWSGGWSAARAAQFGRLEGLI